MKSTISTPFTIVEELDTLLAQLSDSAPLYVCGTDGWFHAPTDYSHVALDDCDLEESYGEEDWNYDIKNRKALHTVGELRRLLDKCAGTARVYVCGSDNWFHAATDLSYASLDYSDLEEYEEDSAEADDIVYPDYLHF